MHNNTGDMKVINNRGSANSNASAAIVNGAHPMNERELSQISNLALAHVGDAVYELMVRTHMCIKGDFTAVALHRDSVARVNAPAQAKAAAVLLPHLNDKEKDVFRRARNARVSSVPKSAGLSEYHAATGLEALFGWLWLQCEYARINELFSIIMEE